MICYANVKCTMSVQYNSSMH